MFRFRPRLFSPFRPLGAYRPPLLVRLASLPVRIIGGLFICLFLRGALRAVWRSAFRGW